MKTIKFKSVQHHWRKEYLGLKSNTVRFSKEDDIRFEILKDFINGKINAINIEIENTITKEVFKRRVTDVSYYCNIFIISWEHKLS